MKTSSRWAVIVLPVLMLGLTSCSTYVENQASQEFMPIYKTELAEETRVRPNGGIYKTGKGGLFATDRRARHIGDILTVQLSEAFNATKAQAATSAKTDNFDVTLPIGVPNVLTGGFGAGQLTSGTSRDFSGSGTASQSNSLSGFLSVTVVQVMDNGNMEILGQKKLNLNNGDEYIRISGIVRPEDISASNLIASNRIADAQITYVGAGEVADSSRQGWLSRLMRQVSPF
ncbi:MAG: flagellar biosynthesis protein FlgH [SAR116 cluster bacterium MED-G04]|jgi:flagellar L-ring protein precursor FlgH|nr:flagellar biosynthesis protein FlgH [SAR116 cluster bacterium]PDH62713.1 MAG: flagellar biosynthesis protein FlgH [SAR116 cluster bacterium MED-G04]CAI8353945.1 MAG: Flagellar L-ring protein [SAR116 cluster bacterium MED-G04]HCV62405.1 flagellar biosynthesis protein FlgH [Alphaproteobacteria bacterium]|tara:strand:- start:2984 stop:3673 length:690 start_codon:yes stop_codon:yes gene_type:complete